MTRMRFRKELYPKIVVLKAAYNFTDRAYLHLDADDSYYYVDLTEKDGETVTENDFENEMLAQSVRHEIYLQTKTIRELLLARAMATTVITDREMADEQITATEDNGFEESDILKDWFVDNET